MAKEMITKKEIQALRELLKNGPKLPLVGAWSRPNEQASELEEENGIVDANGELVTGTIFHNGVHYACTKPHEDLLVGAVNNLEKLLDRLEKAERVIEAADYSMLPRCAGEWIKGSGGHRVHGPLCGRLATWYDENDSFAYCDEHIVEFEKKLYSDTDPDYVSAVREYYKVKENK